MIMIPASKWQFYSHSGLVTNIIGANKTPQHTFQIMQSCKKYINMIL